MTRWVCCALLLAACGGSIEEVDDYERARAEAECNRLESCELGFWEAEYTSEEDCASERQDRLADNDEELDDRDCEYDPEQAAFCVDHIRGMSCQEWGYSNQGGKACDLVWNCVEGR